MSHVKNKFSIALHYQILIMLVAGGLFGYFFSELTTYTNWVGVIFLRALNMIIIPLILCSITTGVASVGSSGNLGRLGLKTMTYYVLSTLAAIITGFLLVTTIKPGVGAELGFKMPVENLTAASESFGQTLINIIPANIFESLMQGQMLAIIFFAILFGFFITKIDDKPRELLVTMYSMLLWM